LESLRQTLHLVTRRDYAILRAAIGESNHPDQWPVAQRLAPAVRELAASAPVTRAEAMALLVREYGLAGVDARRAWRAARMRAHVLHHHETALWHADSDGRFVALEEPKRHDPVEARAEMLRRYLAAFGPASRRDIDAWSMMRIPQIKPALNRLEPLQRFRDEEGRELLDVPRGPLPKAETPAPVRFLPKWDNMLLAFADRTRVIPEEYRKKVIRMNGDVAQTFLVDGFVAGTWSVVNGRVVLEPFAPLSRSAQHELREEVERLEAFLPDG
jgi:Winged helix DNA-binding domain